MQALRISAKDLGQLELANFCPRCMYVKMGVDRRLPFQTFPGIFSSFDSLNKKMVESHFNSFKSAPICFEGIPESVSFEKVKMLEVQDPTTGFHVKGEPDGVFIMKNGGRIIVDYKTARYTSGQDHLLPMYNVQLNVYNYLRIQSGEEPVEGLFLIYLEPETKLLEGEYHQYLTETGYHLDFSAKVVELEIKDEDYIPNLLAKLKKLCLLEEAPVGVDNCFDCRLVDLLISVTDRQPNLVDAMTIRDMLTLASDRNGMIRDPISKIRYSAAASKRKAAKSTRSNAA